MTDKIIAVAAMLDATDGEQDNASRILQRMLASRDRTLIEFITDGLEKIGVEYSLRQEILADTTFPFDAARIDRLTALFKANGLSWRAIARGRISQEVDEDDSGQASSTLDPYNIQFVNGTRKVVNIAPEKKMLYEWPRTELPEHIIALIRPRERNGNELSVSAYTQDSETVIAYGDFIISGAEDVEVALGNAEVNRAMMFKVIVPKNPSKAMMLQLV